MVREMNRASNNSRLSLDEEPRLLVMDEIVRRIVLVHVCDEACIHKRGVKYMNGLANGAEYYALRK